MKNLTLRYSLTQFSYWAASTGASAFAATFLLRRGLSSGWVGALLAAAGLLSCFTQPLLAAAADRAEEFLLKKMMLALSLLCTLFLAVQLLPALPPAVSGLCYMAAIWCSDAMVPLLNAMSVSYNGTGHAVNYGVGRGVGAVASAVAALALGHIIAGLGLMWMLLFLLLFRLLSIAALAGYPRIPKPAAVRAADGSCSIAAFFVRYRWYCVSLLGVLFLGMFHAMTENYMIAIMQRLGGDSGHVGNALFICSLSAAPVILFFEAIRRRIREPNLLKIAAVAFLLKAVLYCFASSIPAVYLLQLLQIPSYAILCPAQVFYARRKVGPADMVKGQAFITAAYALGCSAGNFAGGQLLSLGVGAMLLAGVAMAFAGAVILFCSVERRD